MAAIVRRRSSRSTLALPCLGILLISACAGKGDIDRTQPDKVDKSIFLNADGSPRTFYYRKTTVGVPPTSAYSFEGTMGELMKVRFDIRATDLVGYRSYDYAPGSEGAGTAGTNNQDTPLVMFAITSHFDVKREYNAGTGEQTNVISENTTDRPWDERQFMRIDWSKNLVDTPSDSTAIDPLNPFFPAQTLSTGFSVGEGDSAIVNPDRPIITRDYIDFATKELRTPDYNACMTLFDTSDDSGPWGCGPAEITYRNALLPVPPSQYEPLSYPDRQALIDSNGSPVQFAVDATGQTIDCTPDKLAAAGLSGDDCSDLSMDQFAKFGFFRTVRQTYDRQVGATEQGRDYLINRWNIWQETIQKDTAGQPVMDGNGNPVRLPYAQRKTRTITYYMNPEFPADPGLRAAAGQVIADWNQTMKETVAGLRFMEASPGRSRAETLLTTDAAALPDIFVLKPNSCELGNVQTFLTANPDIGKLVKSKVSTTTLDLDALTAANLTQACSALSAVTETLADDNPKKFTWQRNGDLRYSFLDWIDRPQPSGPLGYGPSSQDPETGEIISAAAYIYGASLDTYAKFAVDSVRLANGQLDPDDILSGKTISDVLAETKTASLARANVKLTDAARTAALAKIQALGPQAKRLAKVAAGIDDQSMLRVHGTPLEKLLFNDDVLPGLIPGYRPGDTPPADAFSQAMNMPWFSSQAAAQRRQRFQTLALGGCLYMAEFADDAILGTALALDQQKLTPDDMFTALRAAIFRGLADHEVGHTMGLRHNFSASTDAFNYDDNYWKIRTTQPQADWDSKYKLSEYAYASVMDYGSRFNSDIGGLGKYDKAAIRFGYGQLIDILQSAPVTAANGLNSAILLDDYSKLPALEDPEMQGSMTAGLKTMDATATTVASYTAEINGLLKGQGFYPERPYKFCSDEFEGNFDCKTWDRGANQQEIVNNTIDLFRNYYVFNAYKRGRTTWQIDSYLNRLESRYFNRYSEAFQFYFFYADEFAGTDFSDDLLLASITSLNALGEVLQTPEPGMHCLTSYSPNVLTVPLQQSDCNLAGPTPTLNLPDAKPYFINFSDDYYYRITRTGSLYEKLEALFTLTSTESRFFRVDTFADSNRYSINYYRIFRDQMVKLFSGVIRNDPASYATTLVNNTVTPTPVVDLATYGVVGAPTPPYALPTATHIDTPVNKTIRYWALLLALSRLGSTWDYTLDFQNYLSIAAKGADDDFTLAPGIEVKEVTHPGTGVIYRAPVYTSPNNIGAEILGDMSAIVGTSGVTGTIPVRLGTNVDGSVLPDWYTAKAALDSKTGGTDQAGYTAARSTFTLVDQLLAYQVDLVGDIRLFRKQINLLNGVSQ